MAVSRVGGLAARRGVRDEKKNAPSPLRVLKALSSFLDGSFRRSGRMSARRRAARPFGVHRFMFYLINGVGGGGWRVSPSPCLAVVALACPQTRQVEERRWRVGKHQDTIQSVRKITNAMAGVRGRSGLTAKDHAYGTCLATCGSGEAGWNGAWSEKWVFGPEH